MQLVGNMCKNKLIIAAAGSGKTTHLVNQAKSIKDQNVLITTYTEANEEEIRKKFNGRIPKNVTIQTWFSFLLQHGVRPYQSVINDGLHDKKIGFFLTDKCSTKYKGSNGQTYSWAKDKNFYQYYFTSKDGLNICSDTIADFIFNCNEKINGDIIDRIARIFPYIFIDEVQDLAGWELEILNLLFNSSSNILLVGDPRQITFLTHHPQKNVSKKENKKEHLTIKSYVEKNKLENLCPIDSTTLKNSHRNNQKICDFSSKLFPDIEKCEPCNCKMCRQNVDHEGIFLVKESDIKAYTTQYPQATILKEKEAEFPDWNFGKSKGLTFERVLIYPTKDIKKWIKDNTQQLAQSTRCKFYVAITRARHSVAIVYNYNDDEKIDGITKWKIED